jgi:hypothetical protein
VRVSPSSDPLNQPLADGPSGSAPPSRWTRVASAVAPALVLIAVAAWEVWATVRAPGSVPDDAAWRRAAAAVRATHRADELIVFAPAWIDPVGRLHLGDLIPVEMAARMDDARYGQVVEVAIRGARAPETAGLSPTSTEDFDGVVVRHFARVAPTIVADVREHLAGIRVEGAVARAPSLELAEVGFAPHRCVQVVPQAGQAMRVTFPQLALGRELVGYVGLADVFTRRDVRAPGRLDVEIGGQRVASATAGVDDGWVRFAAPTTPGFADVTFVATAVGPRSTARLICFAAEARQ